MSSGKHFPKGLDDRMQDENGRIRQKRGDTHIGTIEEQYGVNLGVRSDMHLDEFLRRGGYDSLSDALRDK